MTEKRFFYRDPLAAAWMAKHFGMKIVCGLPKYPVEYADYRHLITRGVEVETGNYGLSQSVIYEPSDDRYDIHPDSMHLLDLQPGDLVAHQYGVVGTVGKNNEADFLGIYWAGSSGKDKPCGQETIIQRNGMAFHHPQSEPA